ncbi:MAG TPA: radical SAM protein [Deltaproteobacteria bacterium]|nr:radical SAM protein [Deltaproteobacteria bacterium]
MRMLTRKPKFVINRLISGGIITNYYCTSRCKHCLYACSPRWDKKYIDSKTTEQNLLKIKSLGCDSIHVGGGEPFLNVEGLKNVLRIAQTTGVHIEYVETNSSWYRDANSAIEILSSLKPFGLSTLLVSISPFHNEYIPFWKVKGVIRACEVTGIRVFPWIAEFIDEISALGDKTTHNLSEYQERYGNNYLKRLPSRYWIHFGGRAVKTFAEILGTKPLEIILESNKTGCRELLQVNHFHLDLFGNYIPGLCSGLAINRDDLGNPISPDKYPFLYTLFSRGISGLYEMAVENHGFEPDAGYMSKCHLCLEIRKFLVLRRGIKNPDLQPVQFYENI